MSAARFSQKIAAEALGTGFLVAAVVGSGIMGAKLAGGNQAMAVPVAMDTRAMVEELEVHQEVQMVKVAPMVGEVVVVIRPIALVAMVMEGRGVPTHP